MSVIEIIHKIQELLKTKYQTNKGFKNQFEYQDRLVELTISDQSPISLDNLADYISNAVKESPDILETIRLNSRSLKRGLTSELFKRFSNMNYTLHLLSCQNKSEKDTVIELEQVINNLYSAFKDYLIGFINFYINNPGLSYALKFCQPSKVGQMFYDYVRQDICLKNYNLDLKETIYLKLMESLISERVLELRKSQIKCMTRALSPYTKSQNPVVSKVSNDLRQRLYDYHGIKCPENLIFLSTLSPNQAHKIAEFISPRFFSPETSINAVTAALKGMLHVLPEDNEKLASLYRLNPSSSYPLVIRKGKLGYIAYLFYKLQELDCITQERLWHSISEFKYFKTMNSKNVQKFVSPNQLSKSLSNKRRRLHKYKGTTPDLELELLDNLLNKILN